MPKRTRPRHGSLQYWPRKRAKDIVVHTSYWPPSKEVHALGFAGWKAGMTHVQLVDQNSKSPTHGKTMVKPVTVLDAPSLFVCAIRFYRDSPPFKVAGEQWAKIPKDLKIDPKTNSTSVRPEKFDDVRLVVATQPAKSGMHKKKSDV